MNKDNQKTASARPCVAPATRPPQAAPAAGALLTLAELLASRKVTPVRLARMISVKQSLAIKMADGEIPLSRFNAAEIARKFKCMAIFNTGVCLFKL